MRRLASDRAVGARYRAAVRHVPMRASPPGYRRRAARCSSSSRKRSTTSSGTRTPPSVEIALSIAPPPLSIWSSMDDGNGFDAAAGARRAGLRSMAPAGRGSRRHPEPSHRRTAQADALLTASAVSVSRTTVADLLDQAGEWSMAHALSSERARAVTSPCASGDHRRPARHSRRAPLPDRRDAGLSAARALRIDGAGACRDRARPCRHRARWISACPGMSGIEGIRAAESSAIPPASWSRSRSTRTTTASSRRCAQAPRATCSRKRRPRACWSACRT